MWLLDTNVISELRKGERRVDRHVWEWANTVAPAQCFVSRVTIAEILVGIERTSDLIFKSDLEAWFQGNVRGWFSNRVIEVDVAVLVAWRRLSLVLQKDRYTLPSVDGLIAASAQVHGLGVVTRNVADFERAGLTILNPWRPLEDSEPHA